MPGGVAGELCTPTGAALLRQFVSDYGAMPQMCVSAAGYGTGKKDFAAANVVRVLLGESGNGDEQVVELCCNIDDQPAESLAFAMDELLALGALVCISPPPGHEKGPPGCFAHLPLPPGAAGCHAALHLSQYDDARRA